MKIQTHVGTKIHTREGKPESGICGKFFEQSSVPELDSLVTETPTQTS
jgi:hypothetical protein